MPFLTMSNFIFQNDLDELTKYWRNDQIILSKHLQLWVTFEKLDDNNKRMFGTIPIVDT